MNERIGELLVKENLLSAEQLAKAREESRSKGGRLGAQITSLGFLDENELTDFVAKQYGVPSIKLDEFEIEDAVIQLIPEEVAAKHTVIPVNRAGSTLILATSDPSNIFRARRHQVPHRLQHPAGRRLGRGDQALDRQVLRAGHALSTT